MPPILSAHMAATRSVVHVNTFSSENFGNTYYKYISNTLLSVLSALFLGKDQLGAWFTKRCSRAVVNCSADVDVDFAVNVNSAAVFMVICLLWRFAAAQSGKRIARVCYAYRGLKKKTEEVNPRSETKLKSENVVNYKKTIAVFCRFLACVLSGAKRNGKHKTDCLPDKQTCLSALLSVIQYNNTR